MEKQTEQMPLVQHFKLGDVKNSPTINGLLMSFPEAYASVLVKHQIKQWSETPSNIIRTNESFLHLGVGVIISVHRVGGVPVVIQTKIPDYQTVVFVSGEEK